MSADTRTKKAPATAANRPGTGVASSERYAPEPIEKAYPVKFSEVPTFTDMSLARNVQIFRDDHDHCWKVVKLGVRVREVYQFPHWDWAATEGGDRPPAFHRVGTMKSNHWEDVRKLWERIQATLGNDLHPWGD